LYTDAHIAETPLCTTHAAVATNNRLSRLICAHQKRCNWSKCTQGERPARMKLFLHAAITCAWRLHILHFTTDFYYLHILCDCAEINTRRECRGVFHLCHIHRLKHRHTFQHCHTLTGMLPHHCLPLWHHQPPQLL
jgi:hypothetical protein